MLLKVLCFIKQCYHGSDEDCKQTIQSFCEQNKENMFAAWETQKHKKNAARVHLKSQQGKAFGGFKVDTFMNLMVRRTLHG